MLGKHSDATVISTIENPMRKLMEYEKNAVSKMYGHPLFREDKRKYWVATV